MTLSMLENKKRFRRMVLIYTGVAVFCLVFFLVYDRFSHGVRSPYMTWLFLWPLVLGVFPCLIGYWLLVFRYRNWLAPNLYHSGVAALTGSSMLRGIFDIAGNASDYQEYLMIAGWVMVTFGILIWIGQRINDWRKGGSS